MRLDQVGSLVRGGISAASMLVAVVSAWCLLGPFPHPSATEPPTVEAPAPTGPPSAPPTVEELKASCLGVVLVFGHVPGKRQSEQLKRALAEISWDQFSNRLTCTEFDARADLAQAEIEGMSPQDDCVLHFYLKGQRVASHRGPWTKEEVERRIRQVLDGAVERITKSWLPDVHGLDVGGRPTTSPVAPTP